MKRPWLPPALVVLAIAVRTGVGGSTFIVRSLLVPCLRADVGRRSWAPRHARIDNWPCGKRPRERGSGHPGWMNTRRPTVTRVIGHGARALSEARARVAAVAAACPRGALLPDDLRLDATSAVVATYPVMDEPSLAELARDRGLTLGECLTVGVSAARTLAALHAAGISHGDVSPANVLARGETVVLIDVVASAGAGERGSPGFAAPERSRGAAPPADVYSLGATLRSVADAQARDIVEAWTAPLLHDDPAARPAAAHSARALERCAPLVPVRRDDPTVAEVVRASAMVATERRPQERWWRAERVARRAIPAVLVAGILLAAGAAVVPDARAALARTPAPAVVPVPRMATIAPDVAAVELTRTRVAAMADSDARALKALLTPGGEAEAASADAIRELGSGEVTFDGLSVENVTASTVSRAGVNATVRVGYDLGEYMVTRAGVTEDVPPSTEQAELVLRLTARGWTVERILPVP